MATLEPTVKARLEIEREGDTEAFQQAAEEVTKLGDAAGAAAPGFEELQSVFKQFASDFGKVLGEAEGDAQRFLDVVKELGQAEGLEEQKAKVEEALEAWESFGKKVPANVRAALDAVVPFNQVTAELKSVAAGLADPIVSGFARAKAAVDEASAAAKSGGAAAQRALVEARLAVEAYADELIEAQAAGATITGDQVERLEELQAEYNSAQTQVAKFRRTQQDVRRDVDDATAAIGGNVQQVRSLDQLMLQINPRVANFALKWGAVLGAVTVATSALGAVEDKLIELDKAAGGTGETFEGLLSGPIPVVSKSLETLASGLATLVESAERVREGDLRGALLGVAEGAGELANLQRILRQEGLDPTNLSLEEMRAKVEELARTQAAQRSQQAAFNADILGSAKSFEEAQRQLRGLVAETVNLGALSGPQVEAFRAAFQRVIDTGALLGQTIDPELQRIARGLGLATTETERAAAAQREWTESLGVSRVELEREAELLARRARLFADANPQLDAKGLRNSPVGEEVQKALDAFERLKLEAPAALQALAAAWGVTSTTTEEAVKRQKAAVADLLESIRGGAVATAEQIHEQAAILERALAQIDIKALDTASLARARQEILDLLTAFRNLGEQVPLWLARAATSAGLFVAQMEVASGAAGTLAGKADDLSRAGGDVTASLDGARTVIASIPTPARDAAAAVQSVNDAAKATSDGAGQAQSKLALLQIMYGQVGGSARAAGEAATSSAGQLGAAKEAVTGLGDAGATAAGKVAQVGTASATAGERAAAGFSAPTNEVQGLLTVIQSLIKALVTELPAAFKVVGAGASGFSSPIIQELDAIVTKAAAAKAALDAVTGEGGG